MENKAIQNIDLGNEYSIRPIHLDEYNIIHSKLEQKIYGEGWRYPFDTTLHTASPPQKHWTWGIYKHEELVGWSHSYQYDERTVYMADTAILPAHQGKGLYTKLLPVLLDIFTEAKFTLVKSHHRSTNNRVIIPKLRVGFYIQGMNLYEGGVNVALTLSLDQDYKQAMNIRSGFRLPTGKSADLLGLLPAEPWEQTKTPKIAAPPDARMVQDLENGYGLFQVKPETYQAIYKQLEPYVYQSTSFDWQNIPARGPIGKPKYTWLVIKDNQVVGWHYSRPWNSRTAYMGNSGLLLTHQRKGLYTKLLAFVLAVLKSEGFQHVRSQHHVTNNAIILPKLRAGFCIQSVQIDDNGVMVVLQYNFNKVYRDYMDIRSGMKQPKGEAAKRMGLKVKDD